MPQSSRGYESSYPLTRWEDEGGRSAPPSAHDPAAPTKKSIRSPLAHTTEDEIMSKVMPPASEAKMDEAETYGIRRVFVEAFEFGGYRYSNLRDAVAQAKRQAGAGN